ncbi:hypothetical protein GCM10022393_39550 [Aquimarina addita]|uniref:Uncharacterized protein n=2 Tax=Aquimarina addita TaxID=870485 RepID=A0ABP6UUJ3_9FLAO
MIAQELEKEIVEVPVVTKTVQGTFDGYEDDIFSFTYATEDGDEANIFFKNIKPEFLKAYELKSNKYVGKSFSITFDTVEEAEVDDDGDTQYNRVRTVTKLALIK